MFIFYIVILNKNMQLNRMYPWKLTDSEMENGPQQQEAQEKFWREVCNTQRI